MSDAFPIDFEALAKGMVIDQKQIEAIYQHKAGADPDAFRLAQMRLVELIEKNRADLYPRIERHSIRIMTDKEAEEYNGARQRAHVRGIARDALRRGRINRSEFSDGERRAAESRDRGFSALALLTHRELRKSEREARLLGGKPDEEPG